MAYTPQTSVTDREIRVQGQANDFKPISTDTRVAEGVTAIDPGFVVISGTSKGVDAAVPVAAFTYAQFEGVVSNSVMSKEQALNTGDKSYESGDNLTIVEEGEIDILLGGTVTYGDDLFFVHTAGGASAIHTFRADLDTDKASAVPMMAKESGVSGDLIKAQVSLGAKISKILT